MQDDANWATLGVKEVMVFYDYFTATHLLFLCDMMLNNGVHS